MIPSRLQLITRSICFKAEGLVTDFEKISEEMMKKSHLSSKIEAKTQLSLAFSVEYEGKKYLVVFVHFPESALDEEAMDITITEQ